jgi:MFS family permease
VSAYGTFFAVYLDSVLGVPTPLIGLLMGITHLASVSALVTPVLVGRWGKSNTVLGVGIGTAVSVIPLALFPHWLAAGGSLFAQAVMNNIRMPAYQQLTQEHLEARWRALVSGAVQTANGASVFVVSLVGGSIVVALGYPAMFVMASVATGIGGVMARLFLAEARTVRS